MRIADIQTAVIAPDYDWTLIKISTEGRTGGCGNGHIHLDAARPGPGIAFNEEEACKYRNREEPFFGEKR